MKSQIAPPKFEDTFLELKDNIFTTFNCHRVGRIVAFNSANQTANVELVDKATKEVFEGNQLITKTVDYPLLTECPVLINKGSLGGFTRPITIGEYCIVHFNDRDIDNWFENGNIQVPNTKRLHNLSDCLVSVGLFSESNSINDYDNNATEMNYQGSKVRLDGNIAINSDQGANLNIDDKVEISNSVQDLKTLVTQLINLLKVFTSVDNPGAPTITVTPDITTQANLDTLLIEFEKLLK
jgi:hypothetical protein